MKKLLLIFTALCVTLSVAAQVRVQGVPRADVHKAPAQVKKAANESEFTFSDIKNWSGEGANMAAFAIQWNTGKDSETTAMVFGYRWDGTATAADMLDAIVKNNPRIYYMTQGGTAYGSTVGGFGWDYDDDGDIALMLNGERIESETRFFDGETNNFDKYTAADPDDYWGAGWFSGYWSLWQKSSSDASWGYASVGITGMKLTNGCWVGFNFAAGMSSYDWMPLESAPALIPDDAETQIIYDNVCYTLTAWGNTKKVSVSAPFPGSGITYTGTITIPATFTYKENLYTVTGVDNEAFKGSTVTAVSLPETVSKIGDSAFENCAGLTSFVLPAALKKIGNATFKASGLTAINIPAAITSIGEGAFEGCSGLTSLTLSEGLKQIGDNAFAETAITSLVLPASLTSIGQVAFFSCAALESVAFAEGLATIGDGAFSYCAIAELVLPESLTAIGVSAFESCPLTSIKSITITPATCGNGAFDETTTASATLTVPYGYIDLYKSKAVWQDFVNFAEQTMPVHVGDRFTKDGIAYIVTDLNANVGEAKVTYHNTQNTVANSNKAGYTGDIVVPAVVNFQGVDLRVTALADSAFLGATALTSVVLPEGLTHSGTRAFYNCSAMTSVTVPLSLTNFGTYSFYGCKALTSIVIPEGTTEIPNYMLYSNEKLEALNLPSTIQTIGTYAFSYCKTLQSVVLPDGITEIGANTFTSCAKLTSVELPSQLTAIPNYMFSNCAALPAVEIPETVTSIGNYAFNGCSVLASISLPQNLQSVGQNAFASCKALTEVTIPESVTSVGSAVFSGCSNLVTAVLPVNSGITSLGTNFFNACSNLKNVTLPKTLTSLGNNAFQKCVSLTSLTLPVTMTSLGSNVFNGCVALKRVTGLAHVKEVPNYGFQNCSELEFVDFGKEVTRLGTYAFQNCGKLTSANFGTGITYIGMYALDGCKLVTDFEIGDAVTSINAYSFRNVGFTQFVLPPTLTSFTGAHVFSGVTDAHIYSAIENPKNANANTFTISTGVYAPVTVLSGTATKYASLTGWKSATITEPQIEQIDFADSNIDFGEKTVTVTVTPQLAYAEALPAAFARYNDAYYFANASTVKMQFITDGGQASVARRAEAQPQEVDATFDGTNFTAESPELQGETAYKYRVVVTDGQGNETASDWQQFTTEGTITAVSDVKAESDVISTEYYNAQGMKSSTPFIGINIVVSTRADGSKTAIKVLK